MKFLFKLTLVTCLLFQSASSFAAATGSIILKNLEVGAGGLDGTVSRSNIEGAPVGSAIHVDDFLVNPDADIQVEPGDCVKISNVEKSTSSILLPPVGEYLDIEIVDCPEEDEETETTIIPELF